ncbi:uncharacterized protein LOC110876045 [Helianthus annuus]|uniref:uncharacterized protein LOC110876045 n=1 Tax=Helianthus annuus TaxID=4232 RepID=UPI000B8FFC03|nr:uncharacterized protein LOC110876045 [Helianthus annuus]
MIVEVVVIIMKEIEFRSDVYVDADAIKELKGIADRMIRSGYEKECCQVYCSVRRDVLDECLSILGVEKVSVEEVQRIEYKVLDEKIRNGFSWVNLRVLYLVSFRLKVDIPVYHGWIIDPQDIETSNAIGSKSYDTLMEDLTDLQIRNMRTLSMNTRDPENHESDEVVKETDTSGGECSGSRIRRDGDWVTFGESTSNEASSSAVNIVRGSAIEMTEIISGSSTSTSNENEDEVGITARQGELIKKLSRQQCESVNCAWLILLDRRYKRSRTLCVISQ